MTNLRLCPVIVLAMSMSALSGADTFVVNPDGTGDYLSIGSAATWAPDGSTIAIAAGTYDEALVLVSRTLSFELLIEGTQVRIRPESAGVDVIQADDCTLTITGLIFDGSDFAAPDSIGLSADGGTFVVSSTAFTGLGYAAVLIVGNGDACTFWDCTFTGNANGIVASIGGTAAPTLQIASCTFSENGDSAISQGGGIRTAGSGSGEVFVSNCTFANNVAFLGGAMMHAARAELEMEGCVFSNNTASNRAGAIMLNDMGWGVTNSIFNCTFTGNSVMSGVSGGGAILYDGATSQEQNFYVYQCLFQDNITGTVGGAIYIQPNGASSNEYLIQETSFIDNSASSGGGIHVDTGYDSPVKLGDNMFCSNDPDPIDAPWTDLGGNLFVDTCSQGACCYQSGVDWACSATTHGACITLGGTFGGVGVDCADIDCDGPSQGACCLAGYCMDTDEATCNALLGEWNDGELCIDVTCDGSTGTSGTPCCIDGTCILLDEADCTSAGGTADVGAVSCDDVTCEAYCPEDVNGDGEVNVDDLLLLIGAWGVCP